MNEQDQSVAFGPGLRPYGAEPAAQSQAEPLVPNAEEAFRIGVEHAAAHLADYARRLASCYEEGPSDPAGWPETTEGAARHELLAFAASIEECAQHESLSPWCLSLAQAIEAQRTATAKTVAVEDESAVAESDAPKVSTP